MDLNGVTEVKYQGIPILGMFHGNDFVWPDPWMDLWDEGTAVVFENVWHDYWSPSNAATPVP